MLELLPLLILPVGILLGFLYALHKDARCENCGQKYKTGWKRGRAVYLNKHLSRDYIPDLSLCGGDGWNTECYCTKCYVELFREDPEVL